MDEKIKTLTVRSPAKENPNMERALFDWPIVLQYWVISRKFSRMKFFNLSVNSFNQPKATRGGCPFDKKIKSLYFQSFVVSALVARFHFKVIGKSVYREMADKYAGFLATW